MKIWASTLLLSAVIVFGGCGTSSNPPGVRRSLLGGASVISSPVKNTNGQLALLVFADDPPKVIGRASPEEDERLFYYWAYYAFRWYSPKGIWLCSEDLVAGEAQREGLSPSIRRVYRKIEHLSFKPEVIPALCNLAASLGATHVVRLKFLETNEKTQLETRRNERPTSGIEIPTGSDSSIILFGGSLSSTTVANVTTVELRVRCYVYQASDGALLFERDFDFLDKQAFQMNVITSYGLRQSFVMGVLREIESRNSLTVATQPASGTRPVNLAMEVWLRQFAADQSYSLIDVGPRLVSIERIDRNLRLNFTLRNSMRDDLTITIQERGNGRPEAFLRDEAGATYYAGSTSPNGNQMTFRPSERKDFYILVPLESPAVKAVNFFSEWDYRSRSQQQTVHLRFPNLVLP